MTVKGRDVQEGTPRAVEVTSAEICVAAASVISRLSRVVQRALGELQPEVASDIYDRGLILTGGGSLLEGLVEHLEKETNLKARVADDPRHASVQGLSATHRRTASPASRRAQRTLHLPKHRRRSV